MKTPVFNFNRFGLLFRRYFTERMHTELIYWGIMIIAFMFLRNFIFGVGFLWFVAGMFYAARFFREIHSPTNGVAYFMIPATHLEKLLVALIMTTIYYFAMMMASYAIGNLLGTFLNNTLASLPFISSEYLGLHELFYQSPLKWILFEVHTNSFTYNHTVFGNSYSYFGVFLKIFILLQSIYLLGGIYFKNNQAFKTFFLTNIIQVCFFILLILEIRLIIRAEDTVFTTMTPENVNRIQDIFLCILHWMFCLLPPFFWVVGYFRLTEKEV
ncbi:MAG: hypothetical protein LBH19_06480 [Dysgonamonadaceae bacterium]|jgi:hypothetical protein|nr:hypothetical protein [Dysgonamonadaceae bacterium]